MAELQRIAHQANVQGYGFRGFHRVSPVVFAFTSNGIDALSLLTSYIPINRRVFTASLRNNF